MIPMGRADRASSQHSAARAMAAALPGLPVLLQDTSDTIPSPTSPGTVSRGPRLPRAVPVK